MKDSKEAPVLTEVLGNVLIITINRPQRKNAMNKAAAELLESVLDEYEGNPELCVAVLTGGDSFFCAGQDLKEVNQGGGAFTKGRGAFGMMGRPPEKPIIAAVEGHVLAGGFELALSCDLIVAGKSASFGLPEVKRSLVAVGGGLFRLTRRIPYHLAMEMALTGEPQPAQRLHDAGLVNRISEDGKALENAIEFAQQIAKSAPLAVRAAKQITYKAEADQWTDEFGWKEQMSYANPVFASDDFQEGLAAFFEKRTPQWKGR